MSRFSFVAWHLPIALLLLSVSASAAAVDHGVQFDSVSHRLGTQGTGQSWGIAWGDINGDGYPDLAQTNHARPMTLHLNDGTGHFSEQASTLFSPFPAGDQHGLAFMKIAGESGESLLIQVGAEVGTGSDPNNLFVGGLGGYTDQAVAKGIDYPEGRGRQPLPVDFNDDGKLDVLLTNSTSTASKGLLPMCSTVGDTFSACFPGVMDEVNASQFAILADLTNDNKSDILTLPKARIQTFFELAGGVPVAVTPDIRNPDGSAASQITGIQDVTSGDFNGDLTTDLLLVAGRSGDDWQVNRQGDLEVFVVARTTTKQLTFDTGSTTDVTLHGSVFLWDTTDIYIGQTGRHPVCSSPENPERFVCTVTLDANNPDDFGLYQDGVVFGKAVLIGIDSGTGQMMLRTVGDAIYRSIAAVFDSTTAISNVDADSYNYQAGNVYLLLNAGTYFEQIRLDHIELYQRRRCVNLVAGDFDNDTDLDAYLVCNRGVANTVNMLLWNDGNAQFTLDPSGAGVFGGLKGRGGSAAIADIDRDGFLDIALTNGYGTEPFSDDGKTLLFRNGGNGNNWATVELNGTVSNPDGLGAVVVMSVGGETLKRDATGGVHASAQDSRLLHFGLGDATEITTLTVFWPSGNMTVLQNLAVDQHLVITE